MCPEWTSFGWLGRQDSNLGMAESKSAALPLGYAPTGLQIIEAARTILMEALLINVLAPSSLVDHI
jgi:hypothetical protein